MCVSPHIARSVTSAPQCGTGSIPIDDIAMILCNASRGIPCAAAICAHWSPNILSAIVKPPDAEPVIPPIIFVVMTADTKGPALSPIPIKISFIGKKPGILTITEPKAKPDATLSTAAQEDAAPKLIVSRKVSLLFR